METEIDLGEKALERKDLEAASEHCRNALAANPDSFEAHLLAGRVAYYSGNLQQAEREYREAVRLKPETLQALEGLATVQMGLNNVKDGAATTYATLISLAGSKGLVAKQREFLWRLAEALDRTGNIVAAEEQLKQLLKMPLDNEEQRLEALCFMADIQGKLEKVRQDERITQYLGQQQQQPGALKRTASVMRLQVDAERADEQDVEEGSLAATLREIVMRALPCPRYARYFERHLQICLSRMGAYPPRSAARNDKRMAALRECVKMITTSAGGCTTPFPFEAAIWLLEEQEELYGGTMPVRSEERIQLPLGSRKSSLAVQTKLKWYRGNSITRMSVDKLNIRQFIQEAPIEEATDDRTVATKHESFGVKLAHQFPWTGSAAVAVGLALRRRFLSDPDAPSTVIRRKQITKVLKRGVSEGADSAAGWKALAELQYQNRQWADAYETSCKGLEWSARRRRAGHEVLTAFALSLRLCAARCLRRLNRLDEAEYSFKVLAGWTTDGECGFDELSGSAPTSIRQQALRGLAKIALQRGERDLAKAQYERILGKALIGRGSPAEHWAHAEYAWLQFEDGDLQTACTHLQKALDVAQREGCMVTDSEIADHHYKLGRILWTMGGHARDDPGQARKHFEAAAIEENDSQVLACAWLGHWYREVALDYLKARNCYEQALALDPTDTVIANHLKAMNEQLGLHKEAAQAAAIAAAAQAGVIAKSAFAARSNTTFAPRGQGSNDGSKPSEQDKESLDRILSDALAERASSMSHAHSANSELAGYWTVTQKK